MHSLRKWFYRPKKDDSSKLAQFYWADEELTMVATELDSFDGRTDPDRCSILVTQLRICQDKVLSICNEIMDDAIPDMRANRDFRAKFPDDVLHENLAGQLWFGAECLAAGSNIIHRELESANLRPIARALTRSLENVRCLLREQSLKNSPVYSEKVRDALRIFDRLFAKFELCYVGLMVPIKSAKEYHLQQEIIVLFSETLIRALKIGLVTQDMVDDYDPSLMFTIPRLAIVWGLLLYPDGPFNVEKDSSDLSELFRPFCSLLFKIRDLLWTLTESELCTLEKMLCSQEEPKLDDKSNISEQVPLQIPEDSISHYYKKHLNCKQFILDFYAYNFGTLNSETEASENPDQNGLEDAKKSDKCNNSSNNCLELEVHQNSPNREDSPEIAESDIETLVSGEFVAEDYEVAAINGLTAFPYCYDGAPSINNNLTPGRDNCEARSAEEHINCNANSNDLPLSSDLDLNDHEVHEISEYCTRSDNLTSMGHAISHDNLYNSLRTIINCNCGGNRESLTPSLFREVMRRVEIIPPGERIGYSSLINGSPRAYHHGLSHSFPSHQGYYAVQRPETSRRRSKKQSRHRSIKNRILHDSEVLTTSCYNSNNSHAHSTQACWNPNPLYSSPLTIPRVQHLRMEEDLGSNSEATHSSCSSCQSISSISSPEWDWSPDTSSYNSECQDDEEIALALQAAEIASRNKARSRFKSSRDLLHKLFVCVSGVADQLQTNCASDLRNILKSVFDMNCTQIQPPETCDIPTPEECNIEAYTNSSFNESGFDNGSALLNEVSGTLNDDSRDDDDRDRSSVDSAEEVVPDGSPTPSLVISDVNQENENNRNLHSGPPEWMPDELSPNCMACKIQFTILRRRHHCRNCGKIFCSRCSANSIPLPRFGHLKPVRVCNQCFMYQLTNMVMQRQL